MEQSPGVGVYGGEKEESDEKLHPDPADLPCADDDTHR